MAKIINGQKISNQILEEITTEIRKLSHLGQPGLAVIQIGKRNDSNIYIRKKCEACTKVGIHSRVYNLDSGVTSSEVIKLIETLNHDDDVHGILVQLPIPNHLDEERILSKISYVKDVDGFHARNIGNLAMENRNPKFIPCTPLGCFRLLQREGVELRGKHAVIVGKSNIVGLPMALILMKEMATITVCHIDTQDLQMHLATADIVISACGQPLMIKKEWLKEGVIIIDVGINPISDATKKRGYRIVGDVDYENVKEIASLITPVPGGVGPMTVAMLMQNTLKGFKDIKGIV